MNAHANPPSRAEQEALSAPFLVEDQDVVRTVARLADERGTPMAEIVKLAINDHFDRHSLSRPAPDWLQEFWRDHPLPLPTGLKADKRFYDSLNDELYDEP